MFDVNWKAIVGTVAPVLATALGGPLAGMAVRTISSVLLGREDGTEDEIAVAAQGMTHEQLLELKSADYHFKEKMLDAGVDLERIAAGDRASARSREVSSEDSRTPRFLAGVVVILFGSILAALISGYADINPRFEALVFGLTGALGAALTQVLNYYFGSTSGSLKKTQVIERLSDAKGPATSTGNGT